MTNNPRNLVGPTIRKLRYQADLTQPQLSARCSRWGWNLSRETLAKIESQLRWVSDFELLCLALALRVQIEELLPKREKAVSLLAEFFDRLDRSQDFG
jgi:transcriptional regulator with XRE-family HTH domain